MFWRWASPSTTRPTSRINDSSSPFISCLRSRLMIRSPPSSAGHAFRQRRVRTGRLHEPLLGTCQPPLDRRQRHPAGGGHLGELHLRNEAEREGQPFVGGKVGEDRVGRAHRLVRLPLRRGHRHLGDLLGRHEPDPAPAPPPPDAAAGGEHRQRRDPAPQRGGVLQIVDPFQDGHEHVLNDVRDLGVDAQRAGDQPLDQRLVPLDQDALRARFTPPERRHQLDVVRVERRRDGKRGLRRLGRDRSRRALTAVRAKAGGGRHVQEFTWARQFLSPPDRRDAGRRAASGARPRDRVKPVPTDRFQLAATLFRPVP